MKKFLRILSLLFILHLMACDSGIEGSDIPPSTVTPEPTVPVDPGEGGIDWTLGFINQVGTLSNPSFAEYQVDYGVSIAVGDWNNDGINDVAVGAPLTDYRNTNSGTVFVYYGSATNTGNDLSPDLRIENPNGLASQFGSAVLSTDNNGDGIDDLIIGAEADDRGPSNDNEGTVYFYYGSATGLATTPGQILDEPNGDRDDGFGSSLAVGDMDKDGFNELIVGTRYGDVVGTDRGQVWIFQGKASGIYDPMDNVLVRDTGSANTEYFGYSVGLFDYDGDTNLDLFVGAPREDTGGTDRGAVQIFLGNATAGSFVASNTVPDVTIANPVASNSSYFGFAISFADVDNDMNTDLIVGAPLTDTGPTNSGSVRIFKDIRSATTEDTFINQPNIMMTGDSYWGYGTAIGDINGDGVNDLLVGGARSDDFNRDGGKIDVFYGAATGDWDLTTIDKSYGNYEERSPRFNYANEFGSAACSGDFNADGLADLAVGASVNDDIAADEGAMYIYYTQADGVAINRPDVTITVDGTGTSRRFGANCISFDFNRDSYPDLLVGAWWDDAGPGNDSGSVYIYYGSATGLQTTPSVTILNPGDGSDGFGASIAYGDLNNDGFNDLAVGAPLDDTGGGDRGTVYIYESNNTTGVIDTATPNTFVSGAANSDQLGYGLAILDLDGDMDDDLAIGIPYDDTVATDSGRLAFYSNAGTPNTLITTATVTYVGNPTAQASSGFGEFLMADFYGSTTFKDLFVGAPDDDVAAANGGALFIYSNGATGISASPNFVFRALDTVSPVNEGLGSSAAVLDVNRDGKLDVVIGAENDDQTGLESGSVYINLQ